MKLIKDKRGVFGLNAVQSFFAIILGIALLAYVIVIIMGTLSGTTILQSASTTTVNESGFANRTGYTLSTVNIAGFSSPAVVSVWNTSSGNLIPNGNVTISSAGVLTNATNAEYTTVYVTYTYSSNSNSQSNLNAILGNTSTGISGFFQSISPVYAILAVLVIILVLVVLVRVVQAPTGRESTPQL